MISSGQKIAVLGLGVSGRAAVKYALLCGAVVRVSDVRGKEQFFEEEGHFLKETDVEWEAGGHTVSFLRWAEIAIVSPGINTEIPLFSDLRREGVKVAGELAIAADLIDVPVVAVTGTNGKTTVTTLIGKLLEGAGKKVFVGGNIGTPLFEYLCAPGSAEYVVAEVSSFQLECCGGFSPDIAVLLNVTPDHLDRHSNMEKYFQAKKQLFHHLGKGKVAIVNNGDSLCRQLQCPLGTEMLSFGRNKNCTASLHGDTLMVSRKGSSELFDLGGTALAGKIGVENCAAAILAASTFGCSAEQIRKVIDGFKPLPHRLQFVARKNGISYYNDSKATNTGAVIAALEHFDNSVVLIAGGRDKGDDYRLLRNSIVNKVTQVVTIGEAAGLLEDALADIVPVVRAKTMKEAVHKATQSSDKGIVLLSPACASFDMFQSYGHRGREFIHEVLDLCGQNQQRGKQIG